MMCSSSHGPDYIVSVLAAQLLSSASASTQQFVLHFLSNVIRKSWDVLHANFLLDMCLTH